MAKFATKLSKTSANSFQAIGTITCSATTRRAEVYDLFLGSYQSPADAAFTYQVQRVTTFTWASATARVPNALDPGNGQAAVTVASDRGTAEPTAYTADAFLLNWAMNQRCSARWQAAPGFGMIVPATNLAGIALKLEANTAAIFECGAQFDEF